MSDTPTAKLYAALLAAQRAVQSVTKDAKNTFNNYEYASAEAMVGSARKALQSAGLVLHRERWEYQMDAQSVGEGSNYPSAMVKCGMAIVHAESGEAMRQEITFPALARKGTPIDKAIAAALTSSLAYWLRDVLLIPRGDFGSVEQHDDQDYGGFSPEDAAQKCITKLALRIGNEAQASKAVHGWAEHFSDDDDRPDKDDFAALWRMIGQGEFDAVARGETDPLADLAGNRGTNGKAG